MPKMKPRMTAKEQAEAFKRDSQKRIDAGHLAPEDADAMIDAMIKKSIKDHGA